jgi:histidinol-phosphate/aromatic aminotransferase/cobyric acid decarboxylase-like protein
MRTVPVPPSGAHGGDARVLARSLGLDPARVLDLSAGCNPFAPDPAPLMFAAIEGGALRRYPDDHDRRAATRALAEVLGVDPGRVLVTNGGAEAIALVAAELGTGWVEDPEFSLYGRHLATLDPGGPRFRSDPRNPTGLLAPAGAEAAVWDEAFYPLATGRWTRRAVTGARAASSVVVGSLTKVLGCPGLRLGYVVAPDDDGDALGRPQLLRRLADRQPMWAVATASLEVLPALLAGADLGAWAAAVADHRRQLVDVLGRHGLRPRPSDANFVLVDGAEGLRERLAPLGVVVRDCASFGLPGSVRVAVPAAAGLERLDAALSAASVQDRPAPDPPAAADSP